MPETRAVVPPRIRHTRLGYVAKLLRIQRASLISFARLHLICIDSAYPANLRPVSFISYFKCYQRDFVK
jgi:hypothetical protein